MQPHNFQVQRYQKYFYIVSYACEIIKNTKGMRY